MATNLLFYGHFVESKAGKTGLTPTVDIDKIEKATGTRTAVVTGGSATEGRRGYYLYLLASATPLTHDYVAIFITTDTSVDQQEVPAARVDYTEARSTELANLDAAVSAAVAAPASALTAYDPPTKAELDAGLAGVTAPTAAAVADAVWDEAIAGHSTAGTTGAQLAAAGSAGDNLLNTVPGDYDQGTAGWALGRIGTGAISTVSPVSASGDVTIDIGYDHNAADGRALTWTDTDGSWVDLTGATATLIISGQAELTCTIGDEGTTAQSITAEPTATETAALKPGRWPFVVDVVRSGRTIKQISGTAHHAARVTA